MERVAILVVVSATQLHLKLEVCGIYGYEINCDYLCRDFEGKYRLAVLEPVRRSVEVLSVDRARKCFRKSSFVEKDFACR